MSTDGRGRIPTRPIFDTRVCGTSSDIIGGRAIIGLGAGGIYISMQQTLMQVTLIQDRARLFGLSGTVVGVSSIVGWRVSPSLTFICPFTQ